MKLISMTDFVLEQYEQCISSTGRTYNYAMFLKQPLELWMFIPCDEEGNVLEEKSIFNTTDEDYIFNSDDFDKYQQAKERCLFEGFEFIESLKLINCNLNEFKKIEDLVKYDLQLTKTAIKQLGL